jgi:beta-phosphoglucomutase-like phosphatase (HAD superfamily)
VKTGIISGSRHCGSVLAAAGVGDLFDVRVDGVESERLGLASKPSPAVFLEAARRLDAVPNRSVVVEDAIAGVQAGRAGRFGLVIGVDRIGNADALRENGADVVVADLGEVQLIGTS